MIDLNKPIRAREDKGLDFSPAPKGDYVLRVLEVSPWKASKPLDIKVIQRDEKGKALKDEKGNNITKLETGVTIYNSNVSFEIVGGEHEGKRVFYNLTTHPNIPFSIPSFLYGLDITSMAASEIPEKCKGRLCFASVDIETYNKTIQNKETGLDEIQSREINKVKNFKQLPFDLTEKNVPTNSNNETIDGI